jgi:hypothetical protein
MTRVREKWTEEGKNAFEDMASPSPSCLKCTHFSVCKIAYNIFPMMHQMFPEHKPFKADEIAKICELYDYKLDD